MVLCLRERYVNFVIFFSDPQYNDSKATTTTTTIFYVIIFNLFILLRVKYQKNNILVSLPELNGYLFHVTPDGQFT